jgi:hypothetical protein
MKEYLKSLLKRVNLYHPLQSFYRNVRNRMRIQFLRITYASFATTQPPFFKCNFCGATYKKFVPEYPGPDIASAINDNRVIAGFGDNVYCPRCLSKNRERLLKAVVETHLSIAGQRVLHFSPEKHLYRFITATAAVTTVDLTPGFYRNIDSSVRYADATSLPFADGSFDLLLANHVLEHIPEDRTAMKEMYRVLDKKGCAILQVPYSETLSTTIEDPLINDPARQAALYGQKDHVRIYSKADYIQRLQHAGFQVEVLTPATLAPFRIYAIQENECVFLCHKQ